MNDCPVDSQSHDPAPSQRGESDKLNDSYYLCGKMLDSKGVEVNDSPVDCQSHDPAPSQRGESVKLNNSFYLCGKMLDSKRVLRKLRLCIFGW